MSVGNDCLNCLSLNEQCLQLKHEVAMLSEKLDNLLKHISHEKVNVSTQTILAPSVSQITQTIPKEFCSINTQTEDIIPENSNTNNFFLQASQKEHFVKDPISNSSVISGVGHDVPYFILPNKPFCSFDVDMLDSDTNFSNVLGNRSLCYYGHIPYSYANIRHKPCEIPASGNYISEILKHLNVIMPDYNYNSVLVTRYRNGQDSLGFHADNEPEIASDSSIVTISLGQARTAKFRKTPASSRNAEHTLYLDHGDVFVMTRQSQEFYEHSIPPASCRDIRISITCRLLKSSNPSQPLPPPFPQVVQEPYHQPTPTTQSPVHQTYPKQQTAQSENITVYISSSMFRHINESKMCSDHQQAKVFYYPGATAENILANLKKDSRFHQIDSSKVTKFYLLCGTNNVDQILNIHHYEHSEFVVDRSASEVSLNQAKMSINQLTDFLHNWAKFAMINIINILPRESSCRNVIINELNNHAKSLADSEECITYVSTEINRNLFSLKNGYRKNLYFDSRGTDNVHMNQKGVIRLAKHLKYHAHHI